MIDRKTYKANYTAGILISSVLHIAGGVIAATLLEMHAADVYEPPQVFSVTLEGGERLGGITQVPLDSKPQKIKALPQDAKDGASKQEKGETAETKETVKESKKDTQSVEETRKAEATEKEAEIKAPTAVEEAEKKKKEQEKKELEEKKRLEEEKVKKKEEDAKKKAEEDKKKKEEEENKKQKEAEEKAAEKKEREDRQKKLMQAISKVKAGAGSGAGGAAYGEGETGQYTGESANAGGEGFGAAALGGHGMGGGTLASIEFIAYRNELENHIKQGWHWMEGGRRLKAQVIMNLSETGVVKEASIASSSGNSYFDDSALRAVYKSSPVPAPPEKLYDQFKEVRITFDSQE